MRSKIFILALSVLILISLVSADIIIKEQPKEIYNLGESFSVPITVKSVSDISGILEMNLLCDGQNVNFYKNGVVLSMGEEKNIESSIILVKEMIGELKGKCRIKVSIDNDYSLSDEFKISNSLNVNLKTKTSEYNPGEGIIFEGVSLRESGEQTDGFISIEIFGGNLSENIKRLGTLNKGSFYLNASTPKNIKSGRYTANIKVYEKDKNSELTNSGFSDYNFFIKQIPTKLDIISERSDIEPGNSIKFKTILTDQAGEEIDANVSVKLKKNTAEQINKRTNEYFVFQVPYNEPPSEWKVEAISRDITTNAIYTINSKETIGIELINDTLIITNKGNVPYNKKILFEIRNISGNVSFEENISLEIDKFKKYHLTAPEGKYSVEVFSNGEKEFAKGSVFLTGKAINIREAGLTVSNIIRHPVSWIFIGIIIIFILFFFIRKGYKKGIFGRKTYGKSNANSNHHTTKINKSTNNSANPQTKQYANLSSFKGNKNSGIGNKAILSLSIKGDRQNVSIVNLRIKNFNEIGDENVKDSLSNVISIAEDKRAFIYDSNNGNYLIILHPQKTKTQSNEITAVEISQKIKEILDKHNKLSRQKFNFGISLDYGEIVGNTEEGVLKFMPLGNLMTSIKKILAFSNNEILLSDVINNKINTKVKTERVKEAMGIIAYRIIDAKDRKEHEKFINNFMNRNTE